MVGLRLDLGLVLGNIRYRVEDMNLVGKLTMKLMSEEHMCYTTHGESVWTYLGQVKVTRYFSFLLECIIDYKSTDVTSFIV